MCTVYRGVSMMHYYHQTTLHWRHCIVCIFVSALTDLRITIYLQDTNNLSPCRLCRFSCTTLQCKMVDIDILHHVYFFFRKFVKNPKKMCFCYSVLANTLIIIVMTRTVTLIVIVVVLVVVGLYQM